MQAQLNLVQANYADAAHMAALLGLLDGYARDPMGGGEPLSAFALQNLPAALAGRPTLFSVLAFDSTLPVGLINCVEGFSTFACQPLVNVHDVVVAASHRGQGIAEKMLVKVEAIARSAEPANSRWRFCQATTPRKNSTAGWALTITNLTRAWVRPSSCRSGFPVRPGQSLVAVDCSGVRQSP